MSKGNIKRKKSAKLRRHQNVRTRETRTAEDNQSEIERVRTGEELSQARYHRFQTWCFNLWKRFTLGFVSLVLLALAAGLVCLIVSYVVHNNEITQYIFNGVQFLVGVVSLVIGIWGLLLAIKSDKRASISVPIDTSPAARNPDPFHRETDVKKGTL